ncbi:histone acetyltransferases subunit 3-domain-containing protein [Halteromyces radiatus]|uniref:histone acetyltransferases subunit 3-domain-containing protein n=1 Tax=Halteromyces radiatus TaxID=101107 RepID=UPI002220865C|nr:histone acetyltransferases subunit 3-domain-containing protein [Halteromyces radiatus]KAI8100175.1 histone acetyltransferases subunit 3-domain-containing protein [Halteromyces radiatus]
MDSEVTRQYSLPIPVSTSTAAHYRQFRNVASTSSAIATTQLSAIPESHDLLNIKTDLEGLLPHSEARMLHLKKDYSHLEKNVKVKDNGSSDTTKKISSGKNMNTMLDKMRIKQESSSTSDDTDELLQSSSTKSDRQVALETLKRRRRREETDSDHDTKPAGRRSESPHPLGKVKKLENSAPVSRSMSPPMSGNSKHTSKPNEIFKKKKLTSSSSSSKESTSNATARAHQLTNGGIDTLGSTNNNKTKSSPVVKNGNNDVDFVRVKPKDQVPILTFWTYLEPYFRPVTEEDRDFLLQKNDDSKPYLIPPLGQHYLETWAEEDRGLPSSRSQSPVLGSSSSSSRHDTHDLGSDVGTSNGLGGLPSNINGQGGTSSTSSASSAHDRLKYFSPSETLTDDYLLTEDLTCGTLTERLLSSLVTEDVGVDAADIESYIASSHDDGTKGIDLHGIGGGDDDDGNDDDDDYTNSSEGRTIVELSSRPPDEVVDFEERLKRELRYAGLFGDDEVDWNAKEDDEICAELRKLSRELKEQVEINEFRKKRLLEVTDRQLQYEQYRHVLDNLDSQVEQCYIKRFRTQKSKKRKTQTTPKSMLSENAVHAMEKRKTWIDALGGIFKDKNMVMPQHSIYDTDPDPSATGTDG